MCREHSHHVAEDQKKKEGEQVPQAWPESHHPVGGGCEEAGGQHTHGNQIKQDCSCEIRWSAVYPTCPLPADISGLTSSPLTLMQDCGFEVFTECKIHIMQTATAHSEQQT